MSQPDQIQSLPPKKNFLRKRLLEASSDDEEPVVEIFTKETPKPQRVSITESKIRGLAEPRKPRIGSQYQAVLPTLAKSSELPTELQKPETGPQ